MLFLVFLCAVFAVALAAPQLAQRGTGHLVRGCAVATIVLTGAAAAASADEAAGFPSLLWSLVILPTLLTVGSGFAALAWVTRWRHQRRLSSGATAATLVDVLLGVAIWIAGAAVTGVMVLAWLLSQKSPTLH